MLYCAIRVNKCLEFVPYPETNERRGFTGDTNKTLNIHCSNSNQFQRTVINQYRYIVVKKIYYLYYHIHTTQNYMQSITMFIDSNSPVNDEHSKQGVCKIGLAEG